MTPPTSDAAPFIDPASGANIGGAIGAGIVGATGAQIGSFLARPVAVLTGLLDKVLPENLVQRPLYEIASAIRYVVNLPHGPLVNGEFPTPEQYSTFVAPITEEIAYRAILQGGLTHLLEANGVPSTLAKVISVAGANFLFAQAHNPNLRQEQFASVFLQGSAFGAAQAVSGTSAAIVAHGVSNAITNYIRQ